MDDILRIMKGCQPVEKVEPKMEDLMGKLRRMQKAKRALEEELKDAECLRKTLQEELDSLHKECTQMDERYKEKEEACKVQQFKCEELEVDANRQLEIHSKNKQLLAEYTFQIQETKLKHRKQRVKFENQLQQLMEQHKNMFSIYSPEGLPREIENIENMKSQLLKAEQMKLKQLSSLAEEIRLAGCSAKVTNDPEEN
ncbi:synaptonemal complex central element protein 1 [Amia ocellicauda]|uniref:synaptonemal complex central element protein 1 n=1 Tax=Amia ocellicauda TaxID=2972642 RepID=UPI0034646105